MEKITCPNCNGRGIVEYYRSYDFLGLFPIWDEYETRTCLRCGGTGVVETEVK